MGYFCQYSNSYRKVVYKSRTWLFGDRTQIEAAAQYRPCGAKFYCFLILRAKMFVYIFKRFCDIHKVKFHFHFYVSHCAILLLPVLQTQYIAYII